MNLQDCASLTISAFVILSSLIMSGCASTSSDGPVAIAKQGSFFVGGRMLTAPGTYDPTQGTASTDPGQKFWVDQMYVQYQIPRECAQVSARAGARRQRHGARVGDHARWPRGLPDPAVAPRLSGLYRRFSAPRARGLPELQRAVRHAGGQAVVANRTGRPACNMRGRAGGWGPNIPKSSRCSSSR